MATFRRIWIWILSGLTIFLGGVAFVLYKLFRRGQQGSKARDAAIEKAYADAINRYRKEIGRLHASTEARASDLEKVKEAIEASKTKLSEHYTGQGLSPDDIARRFSDLNL